MWKRPCDRASVKAVRAWTARASRWGESRFRQRSSSALPRIAICPSQRRGTIECFGADRLVGPIFSVAAFNGSVRKIWSILRLLQVRQWCRQTWTCSICSKIRSSRRKLRTSCSSIIMATRTSRWVPCLLYFSRLRLSSLQRARGFTSIDSNWHFSCFSRTENAYLTFTERYSIHWILEATLH